MAEELLTYFPKQIDTYYEPFIGGGSVMFALLHNEIEFKNVVCSDANTDLIKLWNMIKNNPEDLIDSYIEMWNELNEDDDIPRRKEYYVSVRKRFNENKNIEDFLFLSRTCTNGLIRYNSKGEFNTSFHLTRKGIDPKRLTKVMLDWSNKLNNFDVQFFNQSYEYCTPNENDFVYIDPPYPNSDSMYYGELNYNKFWDWLRKLKCKYMFNFNGTRGNLDNTYNVPSDVYEKHEYMTAGRSGFKDVLSQNTEYVRESLYIK